MERFLNLKIVKDILFYVRYYTGRVIALGILTVIAAIGGIVMLCNTVVTDVYSDNAMKRVYTLSTDAEKIIAASGFGVGEKQRVVLDYFNPEQKESIIVIANPHDALVYDGERLVKIVTVTGTVADAVEAAGLTLSEGDELNFPESMGLTENLQIKVSRAFPVVITADGKSFEVSVTGGTVRDAILKAGLEIGKDDEASLDFSQILKEKTQLQLYRVFYETYKETVTVSHELEIEYDDTMYMGKTKTKTKGVDGKTVNSYRKKYVDGVYVGTELVATKVKKEVVNEVVIRGTKQRDGYTGAYVGSGKVISELTPPFTIALDAKGRPENYLKIITGKATAYCTGTVTSTGARAMAGRVAVDPREIPYGTKMYIVSSDGRYNYGYCVAADTGGFIYTSSTVVDLYMNTYNECITFGRRNVDIYILEWGNGKR